ncbi:MAG: 6-bladed beta-propeller [Phycisphaerales bacterium JB038]
MLLVAGFLASTLVVAQAGIAQEAVVYPADLPTLEAREFVRLGAFDDSVLAFSRITDLGVGPDGRLYVAQAQEASVVVLEPDGALVRRIGRRGQGPGEFLSPAGLGWRGDTLWVVDAASRRISFFLDGLHLRSHAYGVLGQVGSGNVATQLPLSNGAYAAVVTRSEASFAVLAVTANGEVVDTLASLLESYPLRVRVGTSSTSAPFHDFPLFQVEGGGDGVWIVDRPFPAENRGAVTLVRVDAGGDTTVSKTLHLPARPLTDRDWSTRIESLFQALGDTPFSRAEYLAAARRPAFHAVVDRALVSEVGWVWLGRTPGSDGVKEWVLLDPHATPRLRVILPAEFRPYHATADAVWGVVSDQLGIPYLVGFRLE